MVPPRRTGNVRDAPDRGLSCYRRLGSDAARAENRYPVYLQARVTSCSERLPPLDHSPLCGSLDAPNVRGVSATIAGWA